MMSLQDTLMETISGRKDTREVSDAIDLASKLHEGEYRKNNEPYIIHPLNVAIILAQMNADNDTLAAALLHDTVEDSDITVKDLRELFNQRVAFLVDGVSKYEKTEFDTKEGCDLANHEKLLRYTSEDIRVMFLKLADRIHNMRTIEYLSEPKQKENAKETIEFFLPFAESFDLEYSDELLNNSLRCLGYDSDKFESTPMPIEWQIRLQRARRSSIMRYLAAIKNSRVSSQLVRRRQRNN